MEHLLALASMLESLNSTLASVIIDVVNSESPRSVYILCTDCLNDNALQQLRVPRTMVYFDIPTITINDMIVVVTLTSRKAQTVMKDIRVNARARILLLWLGGSDFQGVFATCWSRNIVRVVAALVESQSVPLYSFVPFTQSDCVDMTPIPVGEWPRSITNIFPSGHIKDVKGCLINVTTLHYPPYMILRERMPNAAKDVTGSWAPIILTVVRKMNAKVHLVPYPKSMHWPDRHNITDALFFAKFASTPSRAQIMDMPTIARADCYSFCVPRAEMKRSPWGRLLKPYSFLVWWIILFSFAANLVTTYILLSGAEPISRIILNLTAKLVGGSSCRLKTTACTDMIVAVVWSLSCVIFTTLYQAKEQSFHSSLARLDQIKSVDDIIRIRLPVRADLILVKVVQDLYPKLDMKPFPSEYGMFQEPLNAENGYIANLEECSILNERKGFRKDGRHPMSLLEGCAFVMHERLFLLPRNSPFTQRVSEVNMMLTEAGILHHHLDKEPLPEASSIPSHAFSAEDMEPALSLLVSGLFVATFVFVVELLKEKTQCFVSKCKSEGGLATSRKKRRKAV